MKKRRSRRIPRRVQAEFSAAEEKKIRVGFTSNLSETGMFVGTSRPFPVGTLVKVRLLLDEPIVLKTVVVHSLRGIGAAAGISQSGMGLRLLNSSSKLIALLGLSGSEAAPTSSTSTSTAAAAAPPTTPPAEVPKPLTPAAIAESPPSPVERVRPAAKRGIKDLERRLRKAGEERERLEEMVDADEREKLMLRQLVSKLEMRLAAEAGLTQQAEERETAVARRVASLEVALAQARATPEIEAPLEPPSSAVAERRSLPSPWLMLLAGTVLGVLGTTLLPDLPRPGSTGSAGEPVLGSVIAEAQVEADTEASLGPEVIAETNMDATESAPTAPDAAEESAPAEVQGVSPPESQPIDPATSAEEMVHNWAAAWSEQRVEDYLGFYSAAFEPPDGLTRGAWNDQRRSRLSRPQWIRVEVGAIEATVYAEDRITLTFDQRYETPTYRDRVRKTFDLVRENESWQIVAARSVAE